MPQAKTTRVRMRQNVETSSLKLTAGSTYAVPADQAERLKRGNWAEAAEAADELDAAGDEPLLPPAELDPAEEAADELDAAGDSGRRTRRRRTGPGRGRG